MAINNLADRAPLRTMGIRTFIEEFGERLTPSELCIGANYLARIARSFDDAGEYLVQIGEITPVKKRIVFPSLMGKNSLLDSVLVPTVKIELAPVTPDGEVLEDAADNRIVDTEGVIYSYGIRAFGDGYITSTINEADFALDGLTRSLRQPLALT